MKTFARWLWLCVGLGLTIYLGMTLWLGCAGLAYPYQLDYGEGIVLWFAQQLARGQAIYKGMVGMPYASSNYPPVAMLLSAALMPVFGDGYAGGRLLNFAAVLIVAALIYRIVRAETHDRRVGALALLFFLGSPYIYHWVPLFRVDLVGLAFAFVGVYFVWRWEQSSHPQLAISQQHGLYFFLFTFSFLLALYTKVTLFAAPMAAFGALFLRDKRKALIFAFALGGSGGILYLLLDAATGGTFTFGVIESNATVFLPEQLVALAQNFAQTFPVLLLLAAWTWMQRIRAKKIGVLEMYGVISFVALGMAGRIGAWENYFFEAIAITCVFAFIAIAGQRSAVTQLPTTENNSQSKAESDRQSFLLPILLIVQLLFFWRDHDPRIAVDLMVRDFPANQGLAHLLEQTPGMLISEDMGALVTSGKPVDYYTYQYSMLARSGKWDQSWELNGLRDGLFPLVILERGTREDVDHYRRFTREFVSALDRYYAQTQTIGKYEIYSPAPPVNLLSADFGDAITLVGWDVPSAWTSGKLPVTIVWQAKRVMDRRYKSFVRVENVNGEVIVQDDHEPRAGFYPTTRWAANEMVRQVYMLNLAEQIPIGKYVFRVGWYDADTGDRLPVPKSADDSVVIKEGEMK